MKLIHLFISCTLATSTMAQINAVDRNTGKFISCDELQCAEDDSTYQTIDRICLNCFYRVSDSTMQSIKKAIIQKCAKSNQTCVSFQSDQKSWESKREKASLKEGNKYKGGAMEMTEYIRTKLIMTNKRIIYLRNYISNL